MDSLLKQLILVNLYFESYKNLKFSIKAIFTLLLKLWDQQFLSKRKK